MKQMIRKLLLKLKTRKSSKNDFSDFFVSENSRNKKKVLKKVVKKADNDQRELIKKYQKLILRKS